MRQAEPPITTWRKSSFSDSGEACVELGYASDSYGIRDSKLGAASPELRPSRRAYVAFLTHLRA